MYQTDAEASVLTAIRDMFLGQPDGGALVHRLAIFDAHGDITRIVSQMDVLRYTSTHHTCGNTCCIGPYWVRNMPALVSGRQGTIMHAEKHAAATAGSGMFACSSSRE